MKKRAIAELVTGRKAIDGAGVHLVRVLGSPTVRTFDPFLMLDAFDSENPEDYTKGFPTPVSYTHLTLPTIRLV